MNIKRVLNPDGTFNVIRIGIEKGFFQDIYLWALRVGWCQFLGLLGILYFCANLFFGSLYFALGSGAIDGMQNLELWDRFLESFFFSVQTLATIGYGKMAPVSLPAHMLVTVEALTGMLSLAVATGLVFARFSRPTARVLQANKAVVCPRNGVPTFMFRIANQRANQIVEAQIAVTLIQTIHTAEGLPFRSITDLELVRSKSPLFAATWTVMHPITEKSPFYGMTKEKLIALDAEIIVSFIGMDDTFNQTVHTRYSYTPNEIYWDHVYINMLQWNNESGAIIDLTKIHLVEPLKT